MSIDIWPVPSISSVIGYSCLKTTVVARGYSVISTRFNTCPPSFKVESKIAYDFEAQCSLFTVMVLHLVHILYESMWSAFNVIWTINIYIYIYIYYKEHIWVCKNHLQPLLKLIHKPINWYLWLDVLHVCDMLKFIQITTNKVSLCQVKS